MTVALIVAMALALDYLLGEPKRYHPLVGFGQWVDAIEARLNQGDGLKQKGIVAWCIAVIPLTIAFVLVDQIFQNSSFLNILWSALILYLAIGWQSLLMHARDVIRPMSAGDISAARVAVARIVSRDTQDQNQTELASGAIESVLENGADAILAPLFWFCLLGVPGVVLYRLSNTLDAMWGYRNNRYRQFGWMAAKVDDGLNFVPARLTALSYALLGRTSDALSCWQRQGTGWKSPNAGPVMAAGAGALNISLGGVATYHGVAQQRPVLGPEQNDETSASVVGLENACQLVNRSIALWFIAIALLSIL